MEISWWVAIKHLINQEIHHLTEPKGSLLFLQASAIGSCTYTDESIPNIIPSCHSISKSG